MNTKDKRRKGAVPEAPGAPVETLKAAPAGKKSVLRQRLRHELDSFNFNALLQGVSTMGPSEASSAPVAEPERATALQAEDAAATQAEESLSEPITPADSAPETSLWAVVRTPANFPGFDLDPRRSINPRFVMANAYARAVASASRGTLSSPRAASPLIQGVPSSAPSQRPSVANPNRKIVRGRQRRLRLPFISVLTAVLMLAVGVAAALKWRAYHLPPASHAVYAGQGKREEKSVQSAQTLLSGRHSRHHRRRWRHHREE